MDGEKDDDVGKEVERCAICRSKIKEEAFSLECGHVFHTDCVLGGVDDACSVCRRVSKKLQQHEGLKKRKKEAVKEAKEEQIKDDGHFAQQLYEEQLNPPPIQVEPIARGTDEWNGAVMTIVMWLTEMMEEDDDPLQEYGDDTERKKRALHNIFHGQGAFQRISCEDLRSIAGDALEHDMFK